MSIKVLYLSFHPFLYWWALFFSLFFVVITEASGFTTLKVKVLYLQIKSSKESSSFQIILPIHLSPGGGQFMKWELDILSVCFIFCWNCRRGTNHWLFQGLRVAEWRPGLRKSRFQQFQKAVRQSLLGRNSKGRSAGSWWLYYKQISHLSQCRGAIEFTVKPI